MSRELKARSADIVLGLLTLPAVRKVKSAASMESIIRQMRPEWGQAETDRALATIVMLAGEMVALERTEAAEGVQAVKTRKLI